MMLLAVIVYLFTHGDELPADPSIWMYAVLLIVPLVLLGCLVFSAVQ